MKIWVEGKKEPMQLEEGATLLDLTKALHLTEPHQAVAADLNGIRVDLSTPLTDGARVRLYGFDEPEGKEVFWHTSAHLLAQAVLRLYPEAKLTIGPPIDQGFYYDFAGVNLSEEDFPKIEQEMEKIVKEGHTTHRICLASRNEALTQFGSNPYKKEIIESLPDETFTAYKQGEFIDLCRGPHLPALGKIKAIKLLKISGAYWRGDSDREMLTRIYAITFPDRKLLKDYLFALEEAKKRDHRLLGTKLDLFSIQEEAPGMPFIHPKGMIVWNRLVQFWRELHEEFHYVEIKTPQLMGRELWERSGHWAHYRDNMYAFSIENRQFAIKPMNCPGCMLYYKTKRHSYRELPLRIAEFGHVHRHETSGALSGLFRVRSFHQDDAHLFMTEEQIQSEILSVLKIVERIYDTFGLRYRFELSTRPEASIGTDRDWEVATAGLRNALDAYGKPYRVNEGDGAFYGPKIDIHIQDALNRSWQCGTIQLDMALPEKFELEYMDASGETRRPVMVHRALFGSMERFLGILIEHTAGRFPLWISPVPVRVLTVADRHADYAHDVARQIRACGLLCEVDETSESVNKKVRAAQMEQVNYMLLVGDQELESRTVSLRTRENQVVGSISLTNFLEKALEEYKRKSLKSEFEPSCQPSSP